MNMYKFRAELLDDIIILIMALRTVFQANGVIVIGDISITKMPKFEQLPDRECTIETNLSIDQLREYIVKHVPDSHVMSETLEQVTDIRTIKDREL